MREKLDRLARNRIAAGALLFGWISTAYFLPNRHPIFSVRSVPATAPDVLTPLRLQWTWVYVSYYPFIAGAFFLGRTPELRMKFSRAMGLAALFAAIVFVCFPTRIPREAYPIVGVGWAADLLRRLRAADVDGACLPSMHVAMSLLSAAAYGESFPKFRVPAGAWAALIVYSTMATKQHYFLDAVAGAVLAASAAYCANSAKRSWDPRTPRKK